MTTETSGAEAQVTEQPAAEPADASSTLMGGAVVEQPAVPSDAIGQNHKADEVVAKAQEDVNWLDQLGEGYKGNPALTKFPDVAALAKGYINLEKSLGGNKLVKPDQHATEDDWRAFFQQVGLPGSLEEYELAAPEGVELEDGLLTEMKKIAFEQGIMPKSMQGFVRWYGEQQKAKADAEAERWSTMMSEQKAALEKQWGEAFNQNMSRIQQMTSKMSEALGEEQVNNFLTTQVNGQPLGNNPLLIRMFEHFSGLMNLDELSEGVQPNVMKPTELEGKINSILGNFDHPYYKKDHPNHQAAINEVNSYFERLHPTAKKTVGQFQFNNLTMLGSAKGYSLFLSEKGNPARDLSLTTKDRIRFYGEFTDTSY